MSRICWASALNCGLARSSRRTERTASVTATYVTLSFVMVVDFGRPRDPRIDGAVLRATVELLAETGYPGLLVSAIAERAGTSKPAIYRRWPSKAHLVHEAVFPIGAATELPDTGSLPEDLREMVRRSMVFPDHAGRQGGAAGAGRRDGSGSNPAFGAVGAVRRHHRRWPGRAARAGRGPRRGPTRRDRHRTDRGHRRHHPAGPAHPRHSNSTTPGSIAPPRCS